jgi:hypothetical protein
MSKELKQKAKWLHWIEYSDRHVIAIGKKGNPWDRKVQIRLPRFLCKFLTK